MISASFQGILVTILLLGVLIAIHEAGHFLAAKSLKIPVRQFAIGFGPRIFGFQWNETECRLNWIPLGGYCAFEDDMPENKGEHAPEETGGVNSEGARHLMRNRPVWQRAWVVSAGVIFNFVSALLILWGGILAMGVPTGNQLVYVQKVLPGTPAAAVGLQPGDQITAVDDASFKDFSAFRAALGAHKAQPTSIDIVRGGQPMELNVTPSKEGTIGFAPLIREEKLPAANPVAAAGAAWERQLKITADLWNALAQFASQPAKMMDQTGGPISIVAYGDQIFQIDPWRLVDFAVLLSIELAIINILPLPALDGGHLVLLVLETLRGKPLPRRLEEGILVAGFVMIMGLGMLLILKDIMTVPGMYQPGPAASSAPAHK